MTTSPNEAGQSAWWRSCRKPFPDLVNSTAIKEAVGEVYGIDAEVLPPPPAMDREGPVAPMAGIRLPYLLCVARLMPYKNVDVVIRAVRGLDGIGLVVVGKGPDEARLTDLAADHPDIHILGGVSEENLRWLYANCVGLVAASPEDFGLTPLEAANFGKPTAALHRGGYLDTVDPEINGVFFETPNDTDVQAGVSQLLDRDWNTTKVTAHAELFSQQRFTDRLHEIVAET